MGVRGKTANEPSKPRQQPKAKPDPKSDSKVVQLKQPPKASAPKPAKPAKGHNKGPLDLTDDQVRVLRAHHARQHSALQEKIDTLKAEQKAGHAKALRDGVTVKNIREWIADRKDGADEKIRKEIESLLSRARIAQLPIGQQLELPIGGAVPPDRTPQAERAYGLGKTAGLEGKDAVPPFDGVLGQRWMEGWHDGQKIQRETLLLMQKPRDISDDEFDRRPSDTEAPPDDEIAALD